MKPIMAYYSLWTMILKNICIHICTKYPHHICYYVDTVRNVDCESPPSFPSMFHSTPSCQELVHGMRQILQCAQVDALVVAELARRHISVVLKVARSGDPGRGPARVRKKPSMKLVRYTIYMCIYVYIYIRIYIYTCIYIYVCDHDISTINIHINPTWPSHERSTYCTLMIFRICSGGLKAFERDTQAMLVTVHVKRKTNAVLPI